MTASSGTGCPPRHPGRADSSPGELPRGALRRFASLQFLQLTKCHTWQSDRLVETACAGTEDVKPERREDHPSRVMTPEVLTVNLNHRGGQTVRRLWKEDCVARNVGRERHIVEVLTEVGQFPGLVRGVCLRGVDGLD